MKVLVEKERENIYRIKLVQGVQSFYLNYRSAKGNCEWYAKMFRLALREHTKAKIVPVEISIVAPKNKKN
jgi:hypothetical protein